MTECVCVCVCEREIDKEREKPAERCSPLVWCVSAHVAVPSLVSCLRTRKTKSNFFVNHTRNTSFLT